MILGSYSYLSRSDQVRGQYSISIREAKSKLETVLG